LFDKTDIITGVDVKTMSREFTETWPDGTPNDLRQLGVFADEQYTILGGYAQVTHQVDERLRLVAAGRLDNFFVYDMAFSPKVGLVYNPDELTGVRLSYNNTKTVPTFARTFAQSPIGRRRIGRNGNLERHLYGQGRPLTFSNVRSGLILGNTLGTLYDGIDAPLQLILDDIIANADLPVIQSLLGLQVAGTATGNLFSLENPENAVRITSPEQLNNPKAGFETTTSLELGYQIYVEDKFSINLDLHYNTERNVPTAAIAISPGVTLPVVGSQLERSLLDAGVSPDLAKAVGTLAQENYGNDIAAIVQSDQHQRLGITDGINYGYRGYGEINYFGLDLGAEYNASDRVTFFFNGSLLSNTEFSSQDIDEDPELNRRYFLNVPGTQLRPGVFLHPGEEGGFYGSLAVQYRSSSQANFGDFTGELPATTTVDASIGYQLGNGLSFNLSGTNLTGAEYRGLPYLPVQGRFLTGAVRFELAGRP
ncbi:MAG: TonB-dependent receptor, partial [Bacteroidota bacterium]